MKEFSLMIAEKILYGVCTVGDYLLFGGGKLLRYRSPESSVPNSVQPRASLALPSEHDLMETVGEQEQEWMDLGCPSHSYLPQNAFFNEEFFASSSE